MAGHRFIGAHAVAGCKLQKRNQPAEWLLLKGHPTDDTHRLKSEVDDKVSRLRRVILNASLALTMENLHYHVLCDFSKDPVKVRWVKKDLDIK